MSKNEKKKRSKKLKGVIGVIIVLIAIIGINFFINDENIQNSSSDLEKAKNNITENAKIGTLSKDPRTPDKAHIMYYDNNNHKSNVKLVNIYSNDNKKLCSGNLVYEVSNLPSYSIHNCNLNIGEEYIVEIITEKYSFSNKKVVRKILVVSER